MKMTAITVCAFVVLAYLGQCDAAITAWSSPAALAAASGQIEIAAPTAENSVSVGGTIFTATATSDGTVTDYTLISSTDSVGAVAAGATGLVNVAIGKNLDYETASKYIFVVSATDGSTDQTATVTLTITNVLEFSTTTLTGCVVAGAAAASSVGTWTVVDAASGETVAYTLGGTDAATFAITSGTGAIVVGGTALRSVIGSTYSLTVTATPTGGSSAASGAIPLILTVASTCSGAAQLTALLGVLLLSFLTAASM